MTVLCAIEGRHPNASAGTPTVRCLILACGNTLRCDDGVGPRLASWAEERFEANNNVRVVVRLQWTPDLAEEIAVAESVLFVDSSIKSAPGHVNLIPVEPSENHNGSATHHLDANELLGLALELYGSRPAHSMLLTIGAGSTDLGESFSDSVEAALPRARGVLEKTVLRFLEN
ncbi:MAG: hydrogenase maturation protease [Terracidiphilus sp.]